MADDTGDRRMTDISGVDGEIARGLRQAGYRTVADVRAADAEDLAAVDGISPPLAAHIDAHVRGTADDASDGRTGPAPEGASGDRVADDTAWTTVDPRPTSVPADPPYFEETLTPRVTGGVLAFVLGFALLFGGALLGLILLYAPTAAVIWRAVGLAVLSAAGFGAAWGVGIYYRMRVFVSVTDDGLEVVRNWNSRRGAERVTVPFASIDRVQTTDAFRASRETIAPRDDAELQAYMVTSGRLPGLDLSYRRCVRIDRTEGPPVYVGSARPDELAAVLATKAAGAGEQASAPEPGGTLSGSAGAQRGDPAGGAGASDRSETDRAPDASADGSAAFDGTVPGMSKRREQRGAIAVIIFAVGMIVAIEGFGAVGVLAFLGVLGVMAVVGGSTAWLSQHRQLATFEPTTGTVVATTLVDLPRNRRRPLVKYEYTVAGETYANDKIWPGGPMAKAMGPRTSHDFLAEYPEGDQTTVYYDPDNPADAFIRRHSNARWFALVLLVGLGLVGYSILVVFGGAPPPNV